MRSLPGLAAVCLTAALWPAPGLFAEETRTLKAELSGADLSDFAVENLAGTMRLVPGVEGALVVVATIHADTADLADGVRLERVLVAGSGPAIRVRYPQGVRTIRYRAPLLDQDEISISLGFFSFSSSTYHYDDRTYHVSRGHGKRVWADLEVRVPPHVARARFKNLEGLVEAAGLEGGLRFEVASADLRLDHLAGDLSFGGSSGDIRARDIRGTWKSDFSSGDCVLDRFDGDSLSLHTSSGDIRAHHIRAGRVTVDTSSGDGFFEEADIEEFRGEASSGDFLLESDGSRLRDFRAQTSSGDVTLRLPPEASFDAAADQSSGDMSVAFSDGDAIRHHEKLVAFRRGSGGARIRVETSSGDLAIGPR